MASVALALYLLISDLCHICLFAGVFDPNTVEPIMRALTSAVPQAEMTPGDYRDWDAIRAWATDLAEQL